MDHEKLIESVKSWEALYVMSHARYSDTVFKENAWRAIAKELNQTAAVCKKTWTSLRDSYRRAMKKKRETKSGQAASKVKKWKFEDQMSFLLPYMQERDTCTNLTEVSDDDDENEQNIDACTENNDDREDDGNDNRSNDKDDDTIDDVDNDAVDNDASNAENEKTKKQPKINRNIVTKVRRNKVKKPQAQSETASAVVMKYLLEKKTANAPITPPTKQPSASESFFSSIAKTVENFSPYYQNIAKSKIFAIVTDLEMQQIMQQQQFLIPNAPTQRSCPAPTPRIEPRIPLQSHQFYETGQYNVYPPSVSPSVSIVTTPSPSPSTSATPTPPPSYQDFPETANRMTNEESFFNQYTKM